MKPVAIVCAEATERLYRGIHSLEADGPAIGLVGFQVCLNAEASSIIKVIDLWRGRLLA
jgi:hypothetical protein